MLVFIPAYIVMGYLRYRFEVRQALDLLTGDLSNELQGISTTIDVENIKKLYESEAAANELCPPQPGLPFDDPDNGYFPEDNPYFIEHMEWIQNIIQFEPDRSVYTYIKAPEAGYVIMIGSSWYFTNRDESFKFCQSYNGPTMYASLSERIDKWTPYHDVYGYWITSYIPIKDENGDVLGGVGVDVPASQVIEIRNDLLLRAGIILLGLTFISFFVAYNLTQTISKPLGTLTRLTGSVKDGKPAISSADFNLRRGRYEDEIDVLAKSVEDMLDRLNKQAAELSRSRAEMQNLARSMILTQESERKYISHELHDEAGQLLVTLQIALSDILLELPEKENEKPAGSMDYANLKKYLQNATNQIGKTLNVLRTLSRQMRPPLLDVGDVNLALKQYCTDFSQQTKVEVIYEGEIVPNPPEEVAISFYRFLQEALTNAVKHSQPNRIIVQAQIDKNWIQMSVQDNGQGRGASPSDQGIGLLGLKERFLLLGGNIETKSVSEGFLLVARAPLERV